MNADNSGLQSGWQFGESQIFFSQIAGCEMSSEIMSTATV